MVNRKTKIFTSCVAAAGLSALTLAAFNVNTLNRAPLIGSAFEAKPQQAEAAAAGEEMQKPLRLAPVKAPADGTPLPEIVASVYDYTTGSIGMYKLPSESGGEMTHLSDVSSYYGGAFYDGHYYACDDGRYEEYWDTDSDPHGHRLQKYDPETWTPVGNPVSFATYRSSDLAFNPETGKAYAFCDYGSMMYHLYELDYEAGTESDLTLNLTIMPEESSRALAFDAEGKLWGVTKGSDYGNPKFGTVDLTNGVNSATYTLSSINGGDSRHGWTGDFDPESGNFIFIYNANNSTTGYEEKSMILSINTATGEMTQLAEFPGKCITAMYIVPTVIVPEAPAAPTALSADFVNGSLTGKVNFTMPSTLYNGAAAEGEAMWNVAVGGTVVATGTAAYGAEVSADVTMTQGGNTTFSVFVSNSAGDGKKANVKAYIGNDTPSAPAEVNVLFTENENKFEISWPAVTTGANGGYVDPSAVTYTVTRNPGAVVVAENIAATSFTDIYAPTGIEAITYSVTAAQGDLVSEAAVSDPVVSGSLALPYTLPDDSECLDHWTILDVNADGSTWSYSSYNGVNYRYNSSNPADDWLITPPVKAVAGMKYHVTVGAACYSTSYGGPTPERVEVKWGTSPTAEGMTNVLLEPTVIDKGKDEVMNFEFDVVPAEEGKFFIGIHAVSDANAWYLFLTSMTIAEPVSDEAPAAPSELTAQADRTGALAVSGSVKAPELTAEGNALSSLSKIEIYRGTDLAATVENPVPGSVVEFEDSAVPASGEYSYTAYAYTGTNKSAPSEAVKLYAGVNTPSSVKNIQISETETPGEIVVTWEAPDTDWSGYPLNGDVTYNIEVFPDNAYYHGNKTYEGIADTTFTLVPEFVDARDHGMVYVKVNAQNSKGTGYAEKSANLAVGQPLTLPFSESFPNYTLEHPWGDGASNGPQIASISDDERAMSYNQFNGWNRLMDQSFQSRYTAQDGDNGFAGMMGWSYYDGEDVGYHDEWTELISPKISLEGEDSPMMTFYTFNWLNSNGKDTNRLEIDIVADGERTNIFDKIIGDLGTTEGWEHVAVDLKDYAGKTVYFIFKGTIIGRDDKGYNWILIDNINIGHVDEIDLGVDELSAPAVAEPNQTFNVTARVTNYGRNDISAHKVTLFHNDNVVEAKELGELKSSTSEIVDFATALSVTDQASNSYRIAVETEGDANSENDTTATAVVARRLLLLPTPQNVAVHDGSSLKWEEPDMESASPKVFTDDFESYGDFETSAQFTTEAGEWVFVDVDKAEIGGIVSSSTSQIIEFPGIPHHSQQSWWVQSRLFEEFNNDYFGYSGVQYLANMYVVNADHNRAVQQDDWAISPELCGEEQTISFMARSYDRYHPETIEIYYSDGSTNPSDFTLVRRIENLSGDWTEIVFAVPEGSRRFAIRGCSFDEMNGTNQTFVDDVTFVPATGELPELNLIGYNVYCDNVLMNATPTAEMNFNVDDASKSYAVSAVYETGESRAVVAGISGIGELNSDALKVAAADRSIAISGLKGETYSVYNPAGLLVARSEGRGTVKVPVTSGIYLVEIGSKIWKVAVR